MQGCELTVVRQVHVCILLYQQGNEVVVPLLGGHDQRSFSAVVPGIDGLFTAGQQRPYYFALIVEYVQCS